MSSGYVMTDSTTAANGGVQAGQQLPASATNGNGFPVDTEAVTMHGNHSSSLDAVRGEKQHGSSPHQAPVYHQTGHTLSRQLTAGGHLADDDLLAIGNAHRKIANPLPLGVLGFSSTTLLLSLINVEAAGLETPNAILTFSLVYGGLAQYLAGLWEFATGNTFGATVFCSFGCFWWGFSMILIPFFGLTGSYNGVPGIYSTGSPYAAQETDAIGLYLWTWFGITTIYLFASLRSSVAIFSLIFALWITFILLGCYYYTGMHSLKIAGGAWGIIVAAIGFYTATGSLLTDNTSYFRLPLGSLAPKEK